MGQLDGSHVHKLSGNYVGELHKDMVVANISEILATLGTQVIQVMRVTLALRETGAR